MPFIELRQVTKIYRSMNVEVRGVSDVSFFVSQGEFLVIAGPSGSGKSTLLNLIGCLDKPTSGSIFFNSKNLGEMKGNELSDFRRDNIGFIFQAFNLIPVLTVAENIEYVMLLKGVNSKERKKRVEEVLNELNLKGVYDRKPNSLSGGEQQRVAIARAIVTNPMIVLADEPTANIDSNNAKKLISMMKLLNQSKKITFIFSTHDQNIMNLANRIIFLKDGSIEKDTLMS